MFDRVDTRGTWAYRPQAEGLIVVVSAFAHDPKRPRVSDDILCKPTDA